MGNRHCILLAGILTITVCYAIECDYDLESENGMSSVELKYSCTSDPYPCIQYRHAASNGRTVRLKSAGQYIYYDMTLLSECSLKVTNIVYANDGAKDEIGITVYQLSDNGAVLNEIEIGTFNTSGNSGGDGKFWEIFVSSNQVGDIEILPPGNFRIKLYVIATDNVELDKIMLSVDCDHEDAMCPSVHPLQLTLKSSGGSLSTISIILLVTLNCVVFVIIAVIICFLGCIIAIKFRHHGNQLLDPNINGAEIEMEG